MNCNGCVSTIQQALEADDRISDIQIKLSKKIVSVEGTLSADEAATIIREAGYDPSEATEKKGMLGKLFS